MTGGNAGEHVDGRFALLERLGSGGMGTVWRARDLVLERDVALKEVRPPTSDTADEDTASRKLRERVLREARALARINHPSVVTIHHIIDVAPHPWLVMELVPGSNLQQRLAQGPLAPVEAARIGRQVLSGLRAAHTAGIHHRDVKPANVLLRADGSAVLTDFGIAALQGSSSVTATGELVGSPEYIAPERLRSSQDHPAADLWSLGVLLYTSVEGHSPLRRENGLATLAAVLQDPVPPPVRSGPLTPVLAALLVRDPVSRPDAATLDAMLEAVTRGDSPQPLLPPHTPPAPPSYAAPVAPAPPRASLDAAGRLDTQPTQTSPMPPRAAPVPPGPAAAGPPAPPEPRSRPDGRPVSPPEPRGEGRRSMRAVGAGVAALLALVSLVGIAWAVSSSQEKDLADRPAESAEGRPAPTAAPTPADDETSSSTGPDDAPGSNHSPGAEEITSPTPTSSTTSPPRPESSLGWVAQLFSEPVASGSAVRDKRLAAVRKKVPQARVLRSDDHASLNPGYWVIYAPGPFPDGDGALRFCTERGLTTPQACVGRYVSGDAADRVYVCHPSRGSESRCVRP